MQSRAVNQEAAILINELIMSVIVKFPGSNLKRDDLLPFFRDYNESKINDKLVNNEIEC